MSERPNYIARADEVETRERTPASHVFAFGSLPYNQLRFRPNPIVRQLFPEYVIQYSRISQNTFFLHK